MENTFSNIDLFDQYIQGQLNGAEKTAFEQKLTTEEAFAKDFQLFQELQGVIATSQKQERVETDLADVVKNLESENFFDQFAAAKQEPKKPTLRHVSKKYWWTAAASIALLLSVLSFANLKYSNPALADLQENRLLQPIATINKGGGATTDAKLLAGQQALANKEYVTLVAIYETTLADASQYPLARFSMAFAQYKLGDYNNAFLNTSNVLSTTSLDTSLKENTEWLRLQVLLQQDRTKEAVFTQLLNDITTNKNHKYQQSALDLVTDLNSMWRRLVL